MELEPETGRVSRQARVAEGLLDPQGIDWSGGALYVSTSGFSAERRGNCVLRQDLLPEELRPEAQLATGEAADGAACERVEWFSAGRSHARGFGHGTVAARTHVHK